MQGIILKIVFLTCTFLIAGIPFGLIYVKIFKKTDVRKVGSGNIGATNVLRSAGAIVALLTALSDFLKSLLPVLLGRYIFQNDLFSQLIWVTAICGHCFSPYLGFKGGKGVATFFGGLVVISFHSAVYGFLSWLIILIATGFVSVGSMVASLIPIFIAIIEKASLLTTLIFSTSSIIIIYRHKENIVRLIKGNENRFKILRK
jgi:glycerol-3-phosphate acyltransferase PlsY